jgi:hypothetical protein
VLVLEAPPGGPCKVRPAQAEHGDVLSSSSLEMKPPSGSLTIKHPRGFPPCCQTRRCPLYAS